MSHQSWDLRPGRRATGEFVGRGTAFEEYGTMRDGAAETSVGCDHAASAARPPRPAGAGGAAVSTSLGVSGDER